MTDTFARQRQLIGDAAQWAANDINIEDGEIALLVGGANVRMKIGQGGARPFSTLPFIDDAYFTAAAADAIYLKLSGGTLTGDLALPRDPVAGNQAATKDYVDSLSASSLPLTGGTVTGKIVQATAPTTASDLANKGYVDTMLPLAGGSMTGQIKQALAPVVGNDLTNKTYVDGLVAGSLSYKGTADMTGTTPATPNTGDFYINTTAGTANWTGLTGPISVGDMAFWDGTKWDVLTARSDIDDVILSDPTTTQTITQTVATAIPLQISAMAGSTVNALELVNGGNFKAEGTGQFDGDVNIGSGDRSGVAGFGAGIRKNGQLFISVNDLSAGESVGGEKAIIHVKGGEPSNSDEFLMHFEDQRGSPRFTVDAFGNVKASSGTNTLSIITSDTRIKTNWRDVTHHVDDFDNVETGLFDFINEDHPNDNFGFKAQSLPPECIHLTNEVVPEHEDLYYEDVETLNPDYDEEDPDSQQFITERKRNDVEFDDEHRVKGVNLGATLAKVVSHNQLLKQELTATKSLLEAMEQRLSALESDD